MANRRFFTKSLYRKAIECPTKLFYAKKSKEYADASMDDEFLKALARGGFQVGALAQSYFPGGVLVDTLDYDKALEWTDSLLVNDKVIIFEAALRFDDLFVRVDILVKNGSHCELIEVKSSSINPDEFSEQLWYQKKIEKGIHVLKADWYMEMYDIAFQTYVCRNSKPQLKFDPYLMCVDKTKISPIDGLNQKFVITEKDGRNHVELKSPLPQEVIDQKILCKLSAEEPVTVIISNKEMSDKADGLQFSNGIENYKRAFFKDARISSPLGSQCKKCEFRNHTPGLKCGFDECMQDRAKISQKDLEAPFVFDIWNFRSSDRMIQEGIVLMRDVDLDDIKVTKDDEVLGLCNGERQRLQVEYVKNQKATEYLDKESLAYEMANWKYPFHFIDFETCMVALPFNKGRRPYEQIAFQFSHHLVTADHKIVHQGQFLNAKPGKFPNFDFVRALKRELEGDDGTIFRFAAHENSVLNQIKSQLSQSVEVDKDTLIAWIESITNDRNNSRVGRRAMVDMLEMVKRYYYHPAMGGSNSIKYVLPAVLNESKFLKNKYSKPLYGLHGEVLSQNFETMTWIQMDGQKVKDPYKLLEPVYKDYDSDQLDRLMDGNDEIRNGGAAMTAYCYLQFSKMNPEERNRIEKALLKYCELDTLAMVMIWEHWFNQIGVEAINSFKKQTGT